MQTTLLTGPAHDPRWPGNKGRLASTPVRDRETAERHTDVRQSVYT